MLIKKSLETVEKLRILSQDSQYDLACACGTSQDEHRQRSADSKWIYPVSMQDGRSTFLFKTLLSNICVNNCKYCLLGRHPEYFPGNINQTTKDELSRVPGFGYITVEDILENREKGWDINSILQLGKLGKRLEKASPYITF